MFSFMPLSFSPTFLIALFSFTHVSLALQVYWCSLQVLLSRSHILSWEVVLLTPVYLFASCRNVGATWTPDRTHWQLFPIFEWQGRYIYSIWLCLKFLTINPIFIFINHVSASYNNACFMMMLCFMQCKNWILKIAKIPTTDCWSEFKA